MQSLWCCNHVNQFDPEEDKGIYRLIFRIIISEEKLGKIMIEMKYTWFREHSALNLWAVFARHSPMLMIAKCQGKYSKSVFSFPLVCGKGGHTCPKCAGEWVSTLARYMYGLPVVWVQDSGLALLQYIWVVCGLGDRTYTHPWGVVSVMSQSFIPLCIGGRWSVKSCRLLNIIYDPDEDIDRLATRWKKEFYQALSEISSPFPPFLRLASLCCVHTWSKWPVLTVIQFSLFFVGMSRLLYFHLFCFSFSVYFWVYVCVFVCLFLYAFVLFHYLSPPLSVTAAEAWHSLPSRFLCFLACCLCLVAVFAGESQMSTIAESVIVSAIKVGSACHLFAKKGGQ